MSGFNELFGCEIRGYGRLQDILYESTRKSDPGGSTVGLIDSVNRTLNHLRQMKRDSISSIGRRQVGADGFSTWTPALFFGKGSGDLPQNLSLLRPLAITGLIGVTIPSSASTRTFSINEETATSEVDVERHPNVLQYGFAVEYSFIYLQEQVEDIGLRAPFDHLIPLVEFSFETPLNRGQRGQTTGTINPGVIWSGKYFQVGAEAVVPINSRTGSDVGFIAQLHFYLDDLFPQTIGRPLFGAK